MIEVEWKCPKCGAPPNGCGKGGYEKCQNRSSFQESCSGFLCLCADDSGLEHGETYSDPCPEANCYHCGWGGTFPLPKYDVKKLKGWAKKAYEAGWRPPEGWTP
jgi:hypothetical protein